MSEKYIHLRDAISGDGNAHNVHRMTTLSICISCGQWTEIRQDLFPGQSPINCHDITAKVFKKKLNSLILLVEMIRPNEIDDVISSGIPDNEEGPLLHEIVTKNMIHGPCGILNPNSPCMVDQKCSHLYPGK